MSKVDLSIILPGIRPQNWSKLYLSIAQACTSKWELLICGPEKQFPEGLKLADNVKVIYDKGSPVRASNIAASLAAGKYITWAADDAVYLTHSIDNALETLVERDEMGDNPKDVVVGKYFEGQNGTTKALHSDNYFTINGADSTRSPYINNEWYLFNIAFMHTEFFNSLGGWDCKFEACPMAHTDMACRAYNKGAKVRMVNSPILDCDHMPGTTGDHAPIHHAQLGHDEPLFRSRYSDPNWREKNLDISLDNWKRVPSVWDRRFGQ